MFFCKKKRTKTKNLIFKEKHLYVIVQYTLGLYTIHAQCSRFEIAVVQGARPICRSVRHHIWICILLTPPHGSFMVREISISNILHFISSHGWISKLFTSEMPTGGQLWVSPSSELPSRLYYVAKTFKCIFIDRHCSTHPKVIMQPLWYDGA